MNKYCVALFAGLLLVAGCATNVTKDIVVNTEVDPKANFKGYTTYAWLSSAAILYDPEGKWEPPGFDADAEIKFLIDRELTKRGMTEDSANPDMTVTFAAGIDMSSMEIDIDPESNMAMLDNVPLGALVVILGDTNTDLIIWGGLATAEIQENPGQETIKKRLEYAVTQMFKQLPN
jgi:hypothetical protein